MKPLTNEFCQKVAALAAESEKYDIYSERRSELLREIGKLWEEQGYPEIASGWYGAADLKPNSYRLAKNQQA